MILALFDVLLVPFPYVERLQQKVRPTVVVSRAALIEGPGVFWAAMVTSAEQAFDGDVEISDLRSAGLKVACRFRTAKIACLFPANVVARLGRLSQDDATTVAAGVRRWLADA